MSFDNFTQSTSLLKMNIEKFPMALSLMSGTETSIYDVKIQ